MEEYLGEGKIVYILRSCKEDLTSTNGFKWPAEGPVEAPDWDRVPECGKGLHGWLWGDGNPLISDWSYDTKSKWLVCAVLKKRL